MKNLFTAVILILFSINTFACLSAYQFKTYPVGIVGDTIVSIDFKIHRSEYKSGVSRGKVLHDTTKSFRDEYYTIIPFKVYYTLKQEVISMDTLDTIYVPTRDYRDSIQKVYLFELEELLFTEPNLELFNANHLSFCQYYSKCSIVSIKTDSITLETSVTYKNKEYNIPVLKDSSYYGFNTEHITSTENVYNINSIRVYSTPNIEIVMLHLSPFYDTREPADSSLKDKKREEIYPSKPYTCIAEATYFERLIHHGHTYDIFFVTQ
jgi:hypothetical protein